MRTKSGETLQISAVAARPSLTDVTKIGREYVKENYPEMRNLCQTPTQYLARVYYYQPFASLIIDISLIKRIGVYGFYRSKFMLFTDHLFVS